MVKPTDGTLSAFTEGFRWDSEIPWTSRAGWRQYRQRAVQRTTIDLIIDSKRWPGAAAAPVYLSVEVVVGIVPGAGCRQADGNGGRSDRRRFLQRIWEMRTSVQGNSIRTNQPSLDEEHTGRITPPKLPTFANHEHTRRVEYGMGIGRCGQGKAEGTAEECSPARFQVSDNPPPNRAWSDPAGNRTSAARYATVSAKKASRNSGEGIGIRGARGNGLTILQRQ